VAIAYSRRLSPHRHTTGKAEGCRLGGNFQRGALSREEGPRNSRATMARATKSHRFSTSITGNGKTGEARNQPEASRPLPTRAPVGDDAACDSDHGVRQPTRNRGRRAWRRSKTPPIPKPPEGCNALTRSGPAQVETNDGGQVSENWCVRSHRPRARCWDRYKLRHHNCARCEVGAPAGRSPGHPPATHPKLGKVGGFSGILWSTRRPSSDVYIVGRVRKKKEQNRVLEATGAGDIVGPPPRRRRGP